MASPVQHALCELFFTCLQNFRSVRAARSDRQPVCPADSTLPSTETDLDTLIDRLPF